MHICCHFVISVYHIVGKFSESSVVSQTNLLHFFAKCSKKVILPSHVPAKLSHTCTVLEVISMLLFCLISITMPLKWWCAIGLYYCIWYCNLKICISFSESLLLLLQYSSYCIQTLWLALWEGITVPYCLSFMVKNFRCFTSLP